MTKKGLRRVVLRSKPKVAASIAVAMLAMNTVPAMAAVQTAEAKAEARWSQNLTVKRNGAGEPTIGATVKDILEVDGKYFKDSNGNKTLDVYEDWRKDTATRAEDLVSKMGVDDKIGMMVINSRGMGINIKPDGKTDATGLLDETQGTVTDIFDSTSQRGTTNTIKQLKMRHFILRQNPQPGEMAEWINQMNQVAESTEYGIPVVVCSNSRNENGQMTFGMNDASGVFSTWPGTLGLAAAVKGDIAKGGSAQRISEFANIARSEWDACGIKKGYMYMADTMTDPRWQRTYGTLGEDPQLIADMIGRMVEGFQGGANGVETNGVALTVKHFPGGGARENGFDPHYVEGQWNVYQTKNSLQDYHLPGFKTAIEKNVSSIMPYYAKPAAEKSQAQYDEYGQEMPLHPYGFAFNDFFIQKLLREQLGHKGYVNSDSGIIGNMDWGVEELDVPEKAGLAISVGTDIISDTNNVNALKTAYNRGKDGKDSHYYDNRTIPYGFTVDQVTLDNEDLNRANKRLLTELFELGLFENPYRDPANAEAVVGNQANWDLAYETHQKSVVLLKNRENLLPLTNEKLDGKKVYVRYFGKKDSDQFTAKLRTQLLGYGMNLTEDYNEANYALFFVNPSSGAYFNATKGYLELDICTDKVVHDVVDGKPVESTHTETTAQDVAEIKRISEIVRGNGGKVVSNVNLTLAFMLGNVEPYSDALVVGFDTLTEATMDVITGKCEPSGKMPITLPRNDAVIAVNKDGVCISPNDVPGYAKDKYMPAELKDENGKAYAYRDSEGNYYEMDFGLSYGSNANARSAKRESNGVMGHEYKSTGANKGPGALIK